MEAETPKTGDEKDEVEEGAASVQQERIEFEKMQKAHAEFMLAKEREHKKEIEILRQQLAEARKKDLDGGNTGKYVANLEFRMPISRCERL